MANALFAFEDRAAGQSAARRLIDKGLPADTVKVHTHDAYAGKVTADVDEVVTGGFLGNFMNLFHGIFDWGSSPHEASAYAETVNRGGAVVSVDAQSDSDRAAVDAVMLDAACTQRTDWDSGPTSN
jgi:hypothetical protein